MTYRNKHFADNTGFLEQTLPSKILAILFGKFTKSTKTSKSREKSQFSKGLNQNLVLRKYLTSEIILAWCPNLWGKSLLKKH